MPETKLIREFKCTKCGGEETVAGIAVQEQIDKGKIPPGTPYALRREAIPLLQPAQVALTVPVIIVSWDICAKCGTLYPTRVEIQDAPVQMRPAPGFGFGGNTGGPLPPGFGRG